MEVRGRVPAQSSHARWAPLVLQVVPRRPLSRDTRERLYGGSRHYHLMRRYGIGSAEVDAIIELQDDRCPICGREVPEQVDHDHATGKVRGVLCFDCNGGLGQFRDDPDALSNAIGYLARNDELHGLTLCRARELVKTSG